MKVSVFANNETIDFSKANLLGSSYRPKIIVMNILDYEDFDEELKGGELFSAVIVSAPSGSDNKVGDILYQEKRKDWYKCDKTIQLKND